MASKIGGQALMGKDESGGQTTALGIRLLKPAGWRVVKK